MASAPIIIHVELDTSLSDVATQLENHAGQEVLLVLPEQTGLAYNQVNFTVLAKLASEKEITLGIVTQETHVAAFAKKANIGIYRSLKKEPFSALKTGPLYSIDHVVRFHEDRPQKREINRVSIKELLTSSRGITDIFKEGFGSVGDSLARLGGGQKSRLWAHPQRNSLMLLLGISFAMLLIIVYVALPNATVALVPDATTTEQVVNISVIDEQNTTTVIGGDKLSVSGLFLQAENIALQVPYTTAGKLFEGTNARGQIRVVNKADRPWTFVPRTQFHTPEGIVFRAVNYVNVPANSASGYGEVVIDVVADEFDTAGQPVGERGNIAPTEFRIAKLPDTSQELVSGVSDTPMTGGTTVTSTIVTQNDIEAARALGGTIMTDRAQEFLQQELVSRVGGDSRYKVLSTFGAFEVTNVTSSFDESVLGTGTEQFPVTITGTVRGFAIAENELMDVLVNELRKRQTPRKRLAEVDTSGVTYRVLASNFSEGFLELTTTVKAIEVYDITAQTLAGTNLLNRVREHITGMRIDEATRYIENLPEVDRVEITRWPFWAPTVPGIADNIKFEIVNEFATTGL